MSITRLAVCVALALACPRVLQGAWGVSAQHTVVQSPANDVGALAAEFSLLQSTHRLDEALAVAEAGLALSPLHSELLFGRARVLQELARYPEALAAYSAFLEVDPSNAVARLNIGAVHFLTGNLQAAQAVFESLAVPPVSNAYVTASATRNLGQLAFMQGRYRDAIRVMQRGDALLGDGKSHILCVEMCVRAGAVVAHWEGYFDNIDELVGAFHSQWNTLTDPLFLPFDAVILPVSGGFRRQVAAHRTNMVALRNTLPDLSDRRAFPLLPLDGWPLYQARMGITFAPGVVTPPRPPLRMYGQRMHLGLPPTGPVLPPRCPHTPSPGAAGGLRLTGLAPRGHTQGRLLAGYFSSDFRDHPTAHMIEGLLRHHDRALVAACVLSFGPGDHSDYTARTGPLSDGFVNLARLGFAGAADAIARMGNRMKTLAYHPAAIQVNFVGYPGTSGSYFTEYLIGDRITTPPEHAEHFSEKLVLMPHTYQVNHYAEGVLSGIHTYNRLKLANPLVDDALIAAHAGLKPHPCSPLDRTSLGLPSRAPDPRTHTQGIVFACLNFANKLEPVMFGVWVGVLARVPHSVLWLQLPVDVETVSVLRSEAAARGVHPSRIVVSGRCEKIEHITRMRHVDLWLDTLNCGAHTTGTDVLSAGVPLLAIQGDTMTNRVAPSLLTGAEAGILVTHTLKDYENIAVYLGTHPRVLAALRRHVTLRSLGRPSLLPHTQPHSACGTQAGQLPALLDTARYTRYFEQALGAMWEVRSFGLQQNSGSAWVPMHVIVPQ